MEVHYKDEASPGTSSRIRPAKRPRDNEISGDDPQESSAKRIKLWPASEYTISVCGNTDSSSLGTGWFEYLPEFWDKLSKIPLIYEAVKELQRRTHTRPSFPPPPKLAQDSTPPIAPTTSRELARFARHGGPDLRDLRGYPAPNNGSAGIMSSSAHSKAKSKSTNPTSLGTSSESARSAKSKSAYNRAFDLHLTENKIHATHSSRKPANLDEIRTALRARRPSLSPSNFPDAAFEAFEAADSRTLDEEEVLHDVIPTIMGPTQDDHPLARKTKCTNFEPLTGDKLAPALPDIYFGARPQSLDRSVREKLGRHIMPSTMEEKPLAPNFFMEVKGKDGAASVVERQARYNGAVGARGMHSLQTYGQQDPSYDGNAYTYSATYHGGAGNLRVYAHSPAPPTMPGGRPEYHMTQLRAFNITDSRNTFVEGVTAVRNARDLGKTHRDNFIRNANTIAQRQSSGLGGTGAEAGVNDRALYGGSGKHPERAHAAPRRVDDAFAAANRDSWAPIPQYPDASNQTYDGLTASPDTRSNQTPNVGLTASPYPDSRSNQAHSTGYGTSNQPHDGFTASRYPDARNSQPDDVGYGAAPQPSSKRHRDPLSPGSGGSRQKPRMELVYVDAKYDPRNSNEVLFTDPDTGKWITSPRSGWAVSTATYGGEQVPCRSFQHKERTLYTWTIQ